jgi:histidine triad (HIT) family protein
MPCLFCKIAAKEIPSKVAFEDDQVIAFYDINPAAPVHVLIVPKKHIPDLLALTGEDDGLVAHIHQIANRLAADLGVADKGFRLVNNCGGDGGQTIEHLHFHLLGGRQLHWPPG